MIKTKLLLVSVLLLVKQITGMEQLGINTEEPTECPSLWFGIVNKTWPLQDLWGHDCWQYLEMSGDFGVCDACVFLNLKNHSICYYSLLDKL